MSGNISFLARAELARNLRQRETLLWTFAMPLLFFFFFSKMSGGVGRRGGGDPLTIEQGEQAGFLADALAARLSEQGYLVERPAAAAIATAGEKPERILELPERLSERALAGEKSVLVLRREDEGLSADYDDFRVGRAVYTVLADLAASKAAGLDPGPEAFASLAAMPRALRLEVSSAGKRRAIPTGKEQSIPGTMVMFTLMVLLTSGSVPIVLERRAGLLRRLAAAPISRGEIIAGRWLASMLLALVQIGYAMLAGAFVFGLDWGPNLPAIALVLIPWAGLVSSLALLLGSLARTESQVVGIGVLSANVLAALGGCWWPIEVAPGWMQDLARLLPTGWIMEALHKLISFQDAPASVLPHAAVLAAASVVVAWLGARRFRFA